MTSSMGGGSPTQSGAAAQVQHVVLVVEENQRYEDIVGNSAMPYLNALASQYGLATNYYANVHPSIGNYFMLTTGQVITIDDTFQQTVPNDNLVRHLVNAGKTWKSYAESLPATGYTGGDVFPYLRHHNPFSFLSDVVGTPQANNLAPLSQLTADLANNNLPAFSFILPNANHDMHDCPEGMTSCTFADQAAAADTWLKTNIAPLLANPAFQQNGLLIITFDESNLLDVRNVGGHVLTVIAGPSAKPGYKSSNFYQHQSLLRLMLEGLGVNSFPGAAANAPDMGEFLK